MCRGETPRGRIFRQPTLSLFYDYGLLEKHTSFYEALRIARRIASSIRLPIRPKPSS
jgi:hypothetical protein